MCRVSKRGNVGTNGRCCFDEAMGEDGDEER